MPRVTSLAAAVATAAGVSPATISRYFLHPELIAVDTAQRVETAVRRLGFRPAGNSVGGTAIAGLPQRLALIVCGEFTPRQLRRLPLWSSFFDRLTVTTRMSGSSLICIHLIPGEPLPALLCGEVPLDGLVVIGHPGKLPDELIALLKKIPAVWAMRAACNPNGWIDHVLYDNDQVGPLALQYLLRQGCRRFIICNDSPRHQAYQERVTGFAAACTEAGHADQLHVVTIPDTSKYPDIIRAELARSPEPMGIFVTHDALLLAVHAAVSHIATPIHVVGCNYDQQRLPRMRPRPATIDLHFGEIAEMSLRQLATRAQHPRAVSTMIRFYPTLVPAGS